MGSCVTFYNVSYIRVHWLQERPAAGEKRALPNDCQKEATTSAHELVPDGPLSKQLVSGIICKWVVMRTETFEQKYGTSRLCQCVCILWVV